MRKMILGLILSLHFGPIAQARKCNDSTPARIDKGHELFAHNCRVCHGEKLDGKGPAGLALNPPPRNLITDSFKAGDKPEQIFNTLTNGLKGTAMASFSHLSESDRCNLVYYLKAQRKK